MQNKIVYLNSVMYIYESNFVFDELYFGVLGKKIQILQIPSPNNK